MKLLSTYSAMLLCVSILSNAAPAHAADEQEGFAGVVTDQSGRPIADATVEVNGVKKQTSKDGAFEFYAPRSTRYTINARKSGYALASQIETYTYGNMYLRLVLPKAEIFPINPLQENTIRDLGGTQIVLPAASLVDSSNKPATAPVNVAVYTYNLATEPMPGDMGFFPETGGAVTGGGAGAGAAGYLQSAGVFFIDISDASGKKYNLAAGKQAKISLRAISADPSVGLLSYTEDKGNWKEEGKASLVNGRYEGAVAHFTVWNFDWKKTNPACVKLNVDTTFFNQFQKGGVLKVKAVITLPNASPMTKILDLGDLSNATGRPHSLYNLPPNAKVTLYTEGSSEPYSTFSTGAPWGGTGAPKYPYDACNGKTTLVYPAVPEKPDCK